MKATGKLQEVRRRRVLESNRVGRDWIVADLHGHRGLLERELERLDFDPTRDRVLSVGDLTDRGPDSLHTLMLLEEPWFHAVLGNHELMLLNFLGYYRSRMYSRKAFVQGQGQWIVEAIARHRKLVHRLADRVASLPLALGVRGDVPFDLMHCDQPRMAAGTGRDDDFADVHEADLLTCSRVNLGVAARGPLLSLDFADQVVDISAAPLGERPITFVGHTPVRRITVHDSYVHLDRGVCLGLPRQSPGRPLTVIDGKGFVYWLRGVAVAHRPAQARDLALA